MQYKLDIWVFMQYIDYFKKCTYEDFKYLLKLDLNDYNKPENIRRTYKILKEIDLLSTIHSTGNLSPYSINDYRFEEITRLSKSCFSFLKSLIDEKCNHPYLETLKLLSTANGLYNVFFSSFHTAESNIKLLELTETYAEYNYCLNREIEQKEFEKIDEICNNSSKYSNSNLIHGIASIMKYTVIRKICHDASFNYTVNGNAIAGVSSDCCNKQAELVAELERIKRKYGDELLDIDIEDEEDTDDLDYEKESSIAERYDRHGNNNLTFTAFLEDEEEDDVTIGNFLNYALNYYHDYKKCERSYYKSKTKMKNMLNCQDM